MSDDLMSKAAKIGTEHGKNAASWYFDGNTDNDTYRRVLTGVNDGDPEVMDTLPTQALSGEIADGFSSRDLERELGIDPDNETDDFGDVCDAYEQAFNTAVETEIVRVAKLHLSDD